jgi:esterase
MSMELEYHAVDGAHPRSAIAFLHGILGRGTNLGAMARRFVQQRPNWTAWLVDLRGHGRSPKSTPGPSLQATARDVLDLAARADLPLGAIAGHSFGGKVALEAARLSKAHPIHDVVVIDSVPGARAPVAGNDSALDVIRTIESLPPGFSSKMDFIRAFMAAGRSRTLAEWLAGSVEKENDHVRFMLDLEEIRALILDYFASDLWRVVEAPPDGMRVHLIIADQSDSYSPADRERALRIAASNSRVTADVLPGGHWLHVDNFEGLLGKLLEYIE